MDTGDTFFLVFWLVFCVGMFTWAMLGIRKINRDSREIAERSKAAVARIMGDMVEETPPPPLTDADRKKIASEAEKSKKRLMKTERELRKL